MSAILLQNEKACWIVYAAAIEHYNDIIMDAMASQITSLTIVYSAVYSGSDQRKHQSSTSLAFVGGIHRDHGKCFHLMTSSCFMITLPTIMLIEHSNGKWDTLIRPSTCKRYPILMSPGWAKGCLRFGRKSAFLWHHGAGWSSFLSQVLGWFRGTDRWLCHINILRPRKMVNMLQMIYSNIFS